MPVLVVDHASGGAVTGRAGRALAGRASTSRRASRPTTAYAKKVPGSVIAHAPDADAEAQVVQKYFPNLELQQVKGLPDGVVVFVDASYEPAAVGGAARLPSAPRRGLMRALVLSGGEGLPSSADHRHEREAADPGRGHADPVPGARGDRRGRHRRGGHRDRGRRATRCARRSATVPDGALARHVHPAGSPARHRARRDDRGSVPGRRAVPAVPGRQRAARRGRPVRARSSSAATPTRTSCWPTCASPSTSAWRCSTATGSCASSRSRTSTLSDLALVGVYLFRRSILEACHTLAAVGARRVRDHRGDPVAARRGPRGARRDGERLLEGHRPPRGPARGQPHDAREPRGLDRGRRRRRHDGRGIGGRARRRQGDRQRAARPPRDRRGLGRRPARRSGPTSRSVPAVASRAARWPTRSSWTSCTIADVRGLTGSILGRRVEVRHSGGGGAHRLIVGDQSRVEVD